MHPVVVEFTVVCVRELQPVVPLALPVEEPRHAPKRVAVHRIESLGRIADRVERPPSLRQFVEPFHDLLDSQ